MKKGLYVFPLSLEGFKENITVSETKCKTKYPPMRASGAETYYFYSLAYLERDIN